MIRSKLARLLFCLMLMVAAFFEARAGAEVRSAEKPEVKKEVKKQDRQFSIAMIGKSSTNPVFLSARAGAEAAAQELSKKHGVKVKIDWLTPQREDPLEQKRRIATAVEQKASAILVSCIEAGMLTEAINEAVDKGVPVMTFDSDAPRSKRFSFYGADDEQIGVQVMAELARLMDGKGEIAILAGNRQATNIRKRLDTAKAEAKKYQGMSIVGTFYHVETPEDASAEVIRAMKAYPQVKGWAMLGGWALFDTKLLNVFEPDRIKIVAVDGMKEQLPYVENGIAQVLIAQSTYMWGYFSVNTIFEHTYLDKAVYEINRAELVRVTKDNLKNWSRQLK